MQAKRCCINHHIIAGKIYIICRNGLHSGLWHNFFCQPYRFFCIFRRAVGDINLGQVTLGQRQCNSACSPACPDQQHFFVCKDFPFCIAARIFTAQASHKAFTIKIIAYQAPVRGKGYRIYRLGSLCACPQFVTQSGERHFMRNGHRSAFEIA